MKREKAIEIPFGANDSELIKWEYTIPEGMEAEIKDGKVIIKTVESEDERIRKEIVSEIKEQIDNIPASDCCDSDDLKRLAILNSWLAYLEKQKDLAAIPDELVKNYKLFCENGRREVAVLINAINGINEQKEQRPAEWSEEDEK